MNRAVACLLLLPALGPAAAYADPPNPAPSGVGVCQADADNLCPAAGKDVLMACLAKNIDKIPEGPCKVRVQNVKDRQEAVLNACRNEIAAACEGKDFTAGLVACLKKDAKDLSDDCKEALALYGQSGKGRHHKPPAPANP